jgi:SNF2 family DNA or RNA helicase
MLVETARPAVPWIPHNYQKNVMKFMLENASAGLFLDPGLGKTSCTFGTLKVLKAKRMMKSALVIAPLRVCYAVWPRESEKWKDFNDMKVVVLHGKDKEANLSIKADIYVINPEGLEWLFSNPRFKKLAPDILVIDESSRFKNTQAKRFKALKPWLKTFRRRYILTGTPAPNGLLDLFGQIYILDLGKSFGPYITKFKNDFFDPSGFGGFTWRPKPDTAERINELLKPLTIRLEDKDYLEIPQLVTSPETDIIIDLPDDARKIYHDLEKEMIAKLSETEVLTALSAATASMKCRQLANGCVYRQLEYTPAMKEDRWHYVHDEKIRALEDFVSELNGKPLLVAYEFVHDMERIRKAFPTATFVADISAAKFADVERRWNAGEIEMLVGHPASIGHGLNLQESGNHIVFYGPTWDLELYDQFIKRILRQGNKSSHVFVYHILARNTVDFAVMRALRGKAKVQNSLLESLKDYASEVEFNPTGSEAARAIMKNLI